MTDKTNAAADNAPEAAAPAPSKMDKAKTLFAGLNDNSIPVLEGKSARATFITKAQEPEIGMTKSGAATYWQNLTSAAKGGKLYPHTGSKKKAADAKADDKTDDKGEAAPAGESAEERLKAEEHAEEVAANGNDEDLSHLNG